ncbi:DUF2336 domain-containing protein [Telmatospirillum siberiense]|uniref:DUF2336 domain-containing protein n=1 Tax=Telmatospirillum siberiense TaxID=382514 RepID=A0A2N3PWR4_9PROT|nr:DUF2336 domain-containing protein [Telmatospirillum siberiense]PKU24847.1 hypothetical protein CWS72_09715 [Telmatospirillum siberiense]
MTDFGTLTSEELLALARDRSDARRGELAQIMVDLFRDEQRRLSDGERDMMTAILHQLLGEVEMTVRRFIAEQLASDPRLPRSLARDLANDTIEVAWPLLRNSRVLEDVDLIEVVHQRSLEHRLVIAQRHALSSSVSNALVEVGEESVIVSLLNNAGASLRFDTVALLAERSRVIDAFQEPLLRRGELTPELAKRMFLWVSAALRVHIVERFRIDPPMVDDLLEEAVAAGLAGSFQSSNDVYLIEQMERAGIILPSMMLESLAAGQVTLFSRVVEKLTGIRGTLARRLLFDPSGEGLAVLCRSVELPKGQFIEIFRIASRARITDAIRLDRDCRRLENFYDAIETDAARGVIARWRRSPDYLSVLRSIELARGGRAS